ncbi:MAG: undecaprenyldiphospho-muramoylpentapeptide beta-N-acetylglucosaminyltransferase [Deltaproteobacteria bacterium]|nr:undecaprenyldiphospho-muramoylpentapeptide beta-N-acetylglucosaminyltransferase [Deltaproteobacteria bacterium]
MTLSFVIAGGGTGGHVTPALALGEALRRQGQRVLFLGSQRGLETELVPRAGFELVALSSRQVMGQGLLGKVRGALGILAAVFGARRALKRCGANIVISVGGYASMPATLAAIGMRIPIALVEPNAIPGRVNRLTARFARLVFPGFPITAERLGAQSRSHLLGVPLRESLVEAFANPAERRVATKPFRLLVFGGSQGARQINEAMMAAAPRLAAMDVEVFHCAGEADRDRVATAYEKAGVRAEVVGFEPNLPARYRWADIAICRAGALTIAELALAGLAALLVPYPFAADDHQAANALELEKSGAAERLTGLEDPDSGGDRIASTLQRIFADPDRLISMGNTAQSLARPDAAREIVETCIALLNDPAGSPAT